MNTSKKEFWNVERSIERIYRGPNRPTKLYKVAGSFFWERSLAEAEKELEAAGFKLLKMNGMGKCYKGLAKQIE